MKTLMSVHVGLSSEGPKIYIGYNGKKTVFSEHLNGIMIGFGMEYLFYNGDSL